MSVRVALVTPCLLSVLAACGVSADEDSDGDGLPDLEERDLGLDPLAADTDGDGLADGDEVAFGSDGTLPDADGDRLDDLGERDAGTDPEVADTDGDTYLDGWEVAEGTDPTSERSRIYRGYWPYNPDKDALRAPRFGADFGLGERFPRFVARDQHGDRVDLYDFAAGGRNVVVDVSAVWCGPCNAMSAWLEGDPDAAYYDDLYPGVRQAVEDGDLVWITVLGQNLSGGAASRQDAADWADLYPNARIPVLADAAAEVVDHIGLAYWPSVFALDDALKVIATPEDDLAGAVL